MDACKRSSANCSRKSPGARVRISLYTISHYRSAQRCAAIFPVGGMKHSQDDPRRSLRPPDGGRDDLLGEVMRKKRHRPDLSGSKQELSCLAGSGGSVLRIGITPPGYHGL